MAINISKVYFFDFFCLPYLTICNTIYIIIKYLIEVKKGSIGVIAESVQFLR